MKIEKIKKTISISRIEKDLQKYLQLAHELGATHATILETKDIFLDYRTIFKCMVPKCYLYNTSANCPPHAPSFEQTKELLKWFRFAILIGEKVPSSAVAPKSKDEKQEGYLAPEVISARRKFNKIVSLIESSAFYDGYYYATAFGGGNCKAAWCVDVPCQALENGKGCRFPLRARPTMEAVGINAYLTATNAGWDIYPVGTRCQAEDVPHGMKIGLVLIC